MPERGPDRWVTETDHAFGLLDSYFCDDTGQLPLYRLYNARPDTKHRYTTRTAIRDAMLVQGWVLEGGRYGDAFACAPER